MQYWYCTWREFRESKIEDCCSWFADNLLTICCCSEFTCTKWVTELNIAANASRTKNKIVSSLRCYPFCTPKTIFPNFQCVVCAYKLIFKLTIFAEWAICRMYTWQFVHSVVSFCKLIDTTRARHRKSTTFSMDVTGLSPPPFFKERAWERG